MECVVHFLHTNELLAANPTQIVGRPKLKKPLPKARSPNRGGNTARSCRAGIRFWPFNRLQGKGFRSIFTALLAGLRAEELRLVDAGDVRTLDDGSAVINVKGSNQKGNGGKEGNVPIEAALLAVVGSYLESRAGRFPQGKKRPSTTKVHLYATELATSNVSVYTLMKLLGLSQ